MSETITETMSELVLAFMAHTETIPMSNNFSEYWAGVWKSISQKCLYVFVLQKAFEMFRANIATNEQGNGTSTWSEVFVHDTEVQILSALCKYVKLPINKFLNYGVYQHHNQCQKYYSNERPQRAQTTDKQK